jgi:hypothetical protein
MSEDSQPALEEDERGAPYEQESSFAKLLLLLVVIATSVIFALLALVWASETVIDLTTDGRTDKDQRRLRRRHARRLVDAGERRDGAMRPDRQQEGRWRVTSLRGRRRRGGGAMSEAWRNHYDSWKLASGVTEYARLGDEDTDAAEAAAEERAEREREDRMFDDAERDE